MLIFFLWTQLGCTPKIIRYPGPLAQMGQRRYGYQVDPVSKKGKASKKAPKTKKTSKLNRKVVDAARSFLGKRKIAVNGVSFRYDCSGFVSASFAKAGLQLSGSSRELYDMAKRQSYLHRKKTPFPGDIVFFDNSYDRNKNGKFDDILTHVAIVERIESDGTITMIHLGGSGIVRTYMNLRHPTEVQGPNQKKWNSYLRVRKSKKDKRPRLTGELWKSFATYKLQLDGA